MTDDTGRSLTPKGRDADSPNEVNEVNEEDGVPLVLPNSTMRKRCTRTDRKTNRPSAGSSVGLRAIDAKGDQRYLGTTGGVGKPENGNPRELTASRCVSKVGSIASCQRRPASL